MGDRFQHLMDPKSYVVGDLMPLLKFSKANRSSKKAQSFKAPEQHKADYVKPPWSQAWGSGADISLMWTAILLPGGRQV